MKFYKLFSLLALSVVFAFVINSCSEDTTNPIVNPAQPKPSAITNLMATSINDSTVKIQFTASSSETDTLFKNYTISVYENSVSTAQEYILNAGVNSYSISSINGAKLTEGKIYNFQVVVKFKNDSISTPVVIQWSPASRFEFNTNLDPIWVYETASGFGSGLTIFSTVGLPKVVTVDKSAEWDLGLYTKGDTIIFGSATQLNYNYTGGTPKPTQILTTTFEAESLNDLFDNQALNAGTRDANYDDQAFDFTGANPTKNLIFYVRKMDDSNKYNYAKVMIVKNPNGKGYLQGTAPNRYFLLQISYQKTAGVPYAKVAQNTDSK